MEDNTTHGRIIIREGWRIKASVKIILLVVIMFIIGATVGGITVYHITKEDGLIEVPAEVIPPAEIAPPAETEADKNKYITECVSRFGAYDDRIFTEEISLDWTTGNLTFTPIDCGLDEETQEFVFYLCEGYGLDWTLVMALMRHESEFVADVISKSNDYGLMQINTMNHEWLRDTLGITDFLDKEQNIRAGVFVLRKLFEQYTDTNMVLMAYNMGEPGASRLWEQGIYSTLYVERILKHQEGYIKQLEGESNEEN